MPRSSPQTLRVVAVVELLTRLDQRGEGATMTEIARALDLNQASCVHMLAALTTAGFVVREPADRRYHLGPALAAPGRLAVRRHPRLAAARVEMTALSEELGLPCLAFAREGDHARLVQHTWPPGHQPLAVKVGETLPLTPPLGLVFVAWGDDAGFEAWLRLSPDAAPAAAAGAARSDNAHVHGARTGGARSGGAGTGGPRTGGVGTGGARSGGGTGGSALVGRAGGGGAWLEHHRAQRAAVRRLGFVAEMAPPENGRDDLADVLDGRASPYRDRKLHALLTGGGELVVTDLDHDVPRPITSIGAPVLDPTGTAVLSLSLVTFAEHPLPRGRIAAIGEAVAAAAARLSATFDRNRPPDGLHGGPQERSG